MNATNHFRLLLAAPTLRDSFSTAIVSEGPFLRAVSGLSIGRGRRGFLNTGTNQRDRKQGIK